jgi:hypothetical protein
MGKWMTASVLSALDGGRIEWNRHALERMLERGITRHAVTTILRTGEVIEEYPSDHPFPSALVFGMDDGQPLHAVVAFDPARGVLFVITAYRPDPLHFRDDYRTRR